MPLPEHLATEAAHLLRDWERVWALPGLATRITVKVSPRLRRALGRCYPERALIRLAARAVEGDIQTFREVLCHEAAHLAAHLRHGRAARAHGPEWRGLVEAVGHDPCASLAVAVAPPRAPRTARCLAWAHRCPVCQSVRLAARPVRRWRCRACVEAGLDGRLEISRVAAPGERPG